MRTIMIVVSIVFAIAGASLATSVAAADDRPSGFLVRATPGFGYAFDTADECALDGRMFAGGFEAGYAVQPGVIVGLATTLAFNTLPLEGCSRDRPDDVRLVLAGVFGPIVDWYPLADSGLHARLLVGYAAVDDTEVGEAHGVGATLATGMDWAITRAATGMQASFRIGVELQLTTLRTRGELTYVPAVVGTFTFD